MPETKIMTFVSYENLFENVIKNGLILPKSYLSSDENIDVLIHDLIDELESVEAVQYCSFLNAMVQIYNTEDVQKYGWGELRACRLTTNPENKGIIFHRDSLLHAIGMFIAKENPGSKKITGQRTFENAANFYKSLLLISNKRAFHPPVLRAQDTLLKDNILRAFPYYYFPNIVENIFRVRLQRYWYIYNDLLNEFDTSEGDAIKAGLAEIMKNYGITLNEYFYGMVGIFSWFLQSQYMKDNDLTNEAAKKLGFNHKNIESFYIRRRNFGDNNPTFNIVERLSKDLSELKSKMSTKRRDPLEGYYEHFQCFFDCPIFKIDGDNFCVIDIRFLLDGICSGFIWKINDMDPKKYLSLKEQYGHLIELYFTNLVEKIFGEKCTRVPQGEGEPDAILETENYIIIFEFTVEQYRLTSLYSESADKLIQDVHRVLFNKGKDDENARGKKDRGKFMKLNDYVEKYKHAGKTVIPVLVTENNLGDAALLDEFNKVISQGIVDNGLSNLKENVPTILHLDDMELFWKISDSDDAASQFTDFLVGWSNIERKGPYHFSFSYYMSDAHDGENIKNDFGEFYNWIEFTERIKRSPPVGTNV